MIQLQLQRQIGPFWMAVGQICEGGEWEQDAEELSLYWLAEVYAGTLPHIAWPGPYRVQMSGRDANNRACGGFVDIKHGQFQEYLTEETWRQRDREDAYKLQARK